MPTTVKYSLCLNMHGITITKIGFNDRSKEGADLQADYDSGKNCYEGTLTGVACDCQTVTVEVEGNGPAGGETKMTATMCVSKKLNGQPLKKGEAGGSYNYVQTVYLV